MQGQADNIRTDILLGLNETGDIKQIPIGARYTVGRQRRHPCRLVVPGNVRFQPTRVGHRINRVADRARAAQPGENIQFGTADVADIGEVELEIDVPVVSIGGCGQTLQDVGGAKI